MASDRQETGNAKASGSHRGCRSERRECTRFRLKGEAWFSWEAVDGRRGQGEGVTRNVGKAGTFIDTDDAPPIAAQLRVVVTLRGERATASRPVCPDREAFAMFSNMKAMRLALEQKSYFGLRLWPNPG